MRILIAEDDPVSRRLLEARLRKWGYEVTAVSDGVAALEVLSLDDGPRLAVIDWMMPGMDGIELCRRVRGQGREPYVYIIMLTTKDRKEDIVAGIEAGADDYLTKPFDSQELKVRLKAGVRIVDLEARLIEAREALKIQATHDPLTGLWNRGAAMEILYREIERLKREDEGMVSVILADLDHFKAVNDTYGHMAGDEVLREAARRLSSMARPYDTVARYGGEEFLVILPGCAPQVAAARADAVRSALSATPIAVEGGEVTVTMSAGVAGCAAGPDGCAMDCDRLIAMADAALYRAKSEGRDRVESAAARVG
ncbi:MAG TPA: diguanylate cyclase [Deltaproteobacteria bacterium]|nr:diguanylate cyclase [Deltaproteobacteria bacterium]